MSALIVPDQTAILAAAGINAPKLADFVPPVPTAGLVEFWRASGGVTVVDGKVASWRGFGGSIAAQGDPAKRPTKTTDGVSFATAGALLTTSVIPNATAGYIALKIKRGAAGGANAQLMAGEHQSFSDPAQRLSVGFSPANTVAAFLGTSTPANFSGSNAVGPGVTAVIGIGWNAGSGVLRLNSTQEASRTYNGATNGTPAGVGNLALVLGFVNSVYASSDTLIGIGIYSGVITDTQRGAIDTAMASVS